MLKTLFSSRRGVLGLDLGSSEIKLAALERRSGRVVLRQALRASTPRGVLTQGELTDGLAAAARIRSLCDEGRLRGRKIAATVGGEKVFCRLDVPPADWDDDARAFVRSRASAAIPYPIEAASGGFEAAEGGGEGALQWAAAPAEAVEWLRETIALAGKQASLVAPRACALANVYLHNYEPSPERSALLCRVGARRLSLAVLRGRALIEGRDVSIGRWGPARDEPLGPRLKKALDVHWGDLTARLDGAEPDVVLLSGGASADPDARAALRDKTRAPLEDLDPFRRVECRDDAEPLNTPENARVLAVAVGAALTDLEDL